MPLESTMICLDNSEWMRNGDYIPTRLEAQHDAANLLCGAKTQSNPESTVGILTMAGRSVQVLASPTENMGTLLSAVHSISVGGTLKLSNALQVAQLALKHRRNKTGAQRVVVFVGSPIAEDEKALVKIGKLLKKNNIAVDVVSLGDIDANGPKLQAFVDAASSSNNSHLVTVPPGVLPSDVLVSSPIIHGDDGGMGAMGGAGMGDAFAEFGGVDPSMDPELALALRVSMEEERARQEALQKKAAEEAQQKEAEAAGAAAAAAPATAAAKPASPKKQEAASTLAAVETMEVEKDDAPAAGIPPPAPAPASNLPFMDPTFVNSLLSGLPGVDPNDPKIQAAMAQMTKKDGKKDEEKKEDH
ncbi:hypothetical protein P43SY_000378 [Pythium insidiosum]|uniref:26S proteasome regulatory subunit RPN10 n=1 Tax=Pythium insidiosum TaxID=114742 RepID=A0AAD5M7Y6_PYTIN|nr:hypothetical protein P43SY_000378 [Pythium insidiosum]